uniref:Uncharacterized protein n=1 Tax=Caenorhabditis japonica TaxID=281687 RepID=A0A8R1IQI3_CAEJA
MNCSEIELAEIDKTKNSSKTYSLDMADCPTPPIRHPPDTVKRRANDFKVNQRISRVLEKFFFAFFAVS